MAKKLIAYNFLFCFLLPYGLFEQLYRCINDPTSLRDMGDMLAIVFTLIIWGIVSMLDPRIKE